MNETCAGDKHFEGSPSSAPTLYPVVVGRVGQLHPVAILLAMTAGAVVAGIFGALVAVPLAAVLSAAVAILAARDAEHSGP